jgi:hypothetical protein
MPPLLLLLLPILSFVGSFASQERLNRTAAAAMFSSRAVRSFSPSSEERAGDVLIYWEHSGSGGGTTRSTSCSACACQLL